MVHQGKQIPANFYRYLTSRIIFFSGVLLCFFGILLPVFASSGELQNRKGGRNISISEDTTNTIKVELPLVQSPVGLSRPRFETIHFVLGIGAMRRNFSSLGRLGINKSDLSIPLSIYTYIPFHRDTPSFYFIGGMDIGLGDDSYPAFKALLLYQTKFRLIAGIGAGRTSYSKGGNVNIEAHQSQFLLAFGINLSPQRIDLLLTVPVTSSLSTRFEEAEYSIKPAGIQLSLLVSLR